MKTILVIDDDDGIRKMLSAFLRKHRWRVLEAEGGQQGIELARNSLRPSFVIC